MPPGPLRLRVTAEGGVRTAWPPVAAARLPGRARSGLEPVPHHLQLYTGLVTRPCRRLPHARELAAQSRGAARVRSSCASGGGRGGWRGCFIDPQTVPALPVVFLKFAPP